MNSRSGAVAQAGAGRDRLAHRRSAYAQFGGLVLPLLSGPLAETCRAGYPCAVGPQSVPQCRD
jgi:hypothetical protein